MFLNTNKTVEYFSTMETTLGQRLKIFIESVSPSVRQFEHDLGLGNGTINKVINSNKKTISEDLHNLLTKKYPQLNMKWLMNGPESGEMLIKSSGLTKTETKIEQTEEAKDAMFIKLLEENKALKEDKERLMKWIDTLINGKQ